MFNFLLEQSNQRSNGLPKYHFESTVEIATPTLMKEAQQSFRELCPGGPRVDHTVSPNETLSVKERMEYLSKEIIKTRQYHNKE